MYFPSSKTSHRDDHLLATLTDLESSNYRICTKPPPPLAASFIMEQQPQQQPVQQTIPLQQEPVQQQAPFPNQLPTQYQQPPLQEFYQPATATTSQPNAFYNQQQSVYGPAEPVRVAPDLQNHTSSVMQQPAFANSPRQRTPAPLSQQGEYFVIASEY
jgi:hypothetical protein